MTTLSHTQVTGAVAATSDQELASWVATPDSYVTAPVPMPEPRWPPAWRHVRRKAPTLPLPAAGG